MSKSKLRKEGVENIQLESYQSVKDAINETPNEINFFIHIHLRHYDEQGLGLIQKFRTTFISDMRLSKIAEINFLCHHDGG